MPTLLDFSTSARAKLLLIGDSGTGKTGSLLSLAEAGYHIHILDFDVGLDFLAAQLRTRPNAAELLPRIHYQSFRDKTRLVGAEIAAVGVPKAFEQAMLALDRGIDGAGPMAKLGPDHVVVIDSLSFAGQAAFLRHAAMSPTKDPRQTYGGAQAMLKSLLANLTSDDFFPHVIVNTHVTLIELENGTMKGLPSGIGRAISSEIPKYFNSMLECQIKGVGAQAKRVISTKPSNLVPVKIPLPEGTLPPTLPIETGLAQYFQAAVGNPPSANQGALPL